jgi:glycosyltransferase involved in cell wall biosynthesis
MRNIAVALSESGWDVDVLSPAAGADDAAGVPDVTYHEFRYGGPGSSVETMLNTVRGVRTYRRTVADGDVDVVLDNVAHYPYYPAHFLCPDGATNAVFMHTAFFGAAREFVGPLRGTVVDLIDRTLPLLNRPEIVCAGESTRERIHEVTGYRDTTVLHPTVRTEQFDYAFDPDSTTVLYLGRLGVRKNVACLLRAWRRVERGADRDLRLVVAGTGPREPVLRDLASRLDLRSVEFVGYVSEAEKRRLFSESLLYVLPSRMEGYVTTGLEALASGTPVVGSDTVGINDYVDHGETGYLFPVDDDGRLATLLLELVDDPGRLRPVAEAGRELAREHGFDQFRRDAHAVFSSLA